MNTLNNLLFPSILTFAKLKVIRISFKNVYMFKIDEGTICNSNNVLRNSFVNFEQIPLKYFNELSVKFHI